MKLWRIGVAFAILVVFYGAYVYYEMVVVKDREEAFRLSGLLVHIAPDKVTKITVTKKDEAYTLKKSDGEWRIVDPFIAKANPEEVEDLLDTAKNLTNVKVIADSVDDLREYGLLSGATVVFEQADEKTPVKIIVGDANPAGSEYYVMIGGSSTLNLVKRFKVDGIMPTLFDIREKRLFRRPASRLTGLSYRRGDINVSAKKNNEGAWRLQSPVEADADAGVMNDLADKFISSIASGFIDDSAVDLAEYGLDDPEIEFTAIFADEDEPETMLVGGLTAGNNRYAMMAGVGKAVVRVPGDITTGLPESVSEMRDRSLVKIDVEDVTALTISYEGKTVKLLSAALNETPERLWRIAEPVETDADPVVVNGLLYDLVHSKTIGYASEGEFDPARFGLDNPTLNIDLDAGSRSINMKFAFTGKEKRHYYVWVGNKPFVRELKAEDYVKFAKNLLDLRDRRFFTKKSDDVGRIAIKRLDQVFDASRSGDDYLLTSPEKARLTPAVWHKLVWIVTGLKYVEIVESTKEVIKKAGYENPVLEISVYDTKNRLLEGVVVGSRDERKKRYYARTVKKEGIFMIDESFVTVDIVLALESLLASDEGGLIRNPHIQG